MRRTVSRMARRSGGCRGSRTSRTRPAPTARGGCRRQAWLTPQPRRGREVAGDDHDVALPWREPHRLGAEAGNVVAGGPRRHQLDAATGGGERHRPEAVLTDEVGHPVELGDKEVAVGGYRHWNTPLRQA